MTPPPRPFLVTFTRAPDMMRRHARYQRKKPTRAQLIAHNLKRRPAPVLPEPVATPAPVGAGHAGYHVEQNGTWFTLYGPDGRKVGTSQRDEDGAWAQVPGCD